MSQSKKDKNKSRDFGNQVFVNDGNLEDALRRLNKRIKDSGIMEDLKNKSYYIKPSAVKRKKRLSKKPQ
jgi:ribosomal protein S21